MNRFAKLIRKVSGAKDVGPGIDTILLYNVDTQVCLRYMQPLEIAVFPYVRKTLSIEPIHEKFD